MELSKKASSFKSQQLSIALFVLVIVIIYLIDHREAFWEGVVAGLNAFSSK